MSQQMHQNPDPAWARAIGATLRPQRPGTQPWRVDLINGPNMSNLGPGGRDPRTYGSATSLAALQDSIVAMGQGLGLDMRAFSSNHEGAIVAHIYETADEVDRFLINPAALTRFGRPTTIAFADVRRPFIELHFANVAALGWEGGMTTPVATGVAMGFRHYSSYVSGVIMWRRRPKAADSAVMPNFAAA